MYKKFFRTVYQERLFFYYFKNNIKKIPQSGENAYLAMKNPSQFGLTLFVQSTVLHWQKQKKKNWDSP